MAMIEVPVETVQKMTTYVKSAQAALADHAKADSLRLKSAGAAADALVRGGWIPAAARDAKVKQYGSFPEKIAEDLSSVATKSASLGAPSSKVSEQKLSAEDEFKQRIVGYGR